MEKGIHVKEIYVSGSKKYEVWTEGCRCCSRHFEGSFIKESEALNLKREIENDLDPRCDARVVVIEVGS